MFRSEILLYAIALGKEGSAGWWCTYCKLVKLDSQINGYERGHSWTINNIALYAEGIADLEQGRDRMGVNKTPVFE